MPSSRVGVEGYRGGIIYKIHDWHYKGEQGSPTCSSTGTKRHQIKWPVSSGNTNKNQRDRPTLGKIRNFWPSALLIGPDISICPKARKWLLFLFHNKWNRLCWDFSKVPCSQDNSVNVFKTGILQLQIKRSWTSGIVEHQRKRGVWIFKEKYFKSVSHSVTYTQELKHALSKCIWG